MVSRRNTYRVHRGAIGGAQKIVVSTVGAGSSNDVFLEDDPAFKRLCDWTPDGRAVVISRQEAATRWDLWILPLDDDRKPRPYLVTKYLEDNAKVSPDGHWLSYESDESGHNEVYVQSFPEAGAKYQVTTGGGFNIGWSSNGRALYYGNPAAPDRILAADVLPGPQFRLGPPRVAGRVPEKAFDADMTRDDSKLLVLMPNEPVPALTITIVENWPSLLVKK